MPTFSANTYYEYTNQRFGNFSGGTWSSNLGNVPHPIGTRNNTSSTGDTIIEYSSITIGGFNGLNN
jgi:hypothetical protein